MKTKNLSFVYENTDIPLYTVELLQIAAKIGDNTYICCSAMSNSVIGNIQTSAQEVPLYTDFG